MAFKVIPTPLFAKRVKALAKKYRSLGDDLLDLGARLARDPRSGTGLGHGVYKVRLAIRSKGKGKSGGARVITYVVTEDEELYLLSIYDKSDIDSLDTKAIRSMVAQVHLDKGSSRK